MAPVRKCFVCENIGKKEGIHYHKLPSKDQAETRTQWIYWITKETGHDSLTKDSVLICSEHFEEKHKSGIKLVKGAVPCLRGNILNSVVPVDFPPDATPTLETKLAAMTLNLGGVNEVMYRNKFNEMLDGVNIALLQEFHHELAVNCNFRKIDCYKKGRTKTNLCILISRNFFNNFDSPDKFYFDGIEHEKTEGTVVQYSYMYCCLRLEQTSYFIVNVHIKHEEYATIENLQELQRNLKAKSQQFFKGDTTFCWMIGGDFNFISRFEDGEAESSLKWWRHYFIDTLPAKDIYPRSSRQEVKCTHNGRRIDRLYVDERLLNCIVSSWTGSEKLKDHCPVYCTMSPMDGTEEVKKCLCCGRQQGKVRCSTCCLWVCSKCASKEEISSKRHEKCHMTRSTTLGWTFKHTDLGNLYRDGAIDGSAEVTDFPQILPLRKNAVGLYDTKLKIYSCKSCDERRRRRDMKLLGDLLKKYYGVKLKDLMKKENKDLKKKMRSADPEE